MNLLSVVILIIATAVTVGGFGSTAQAATAADILNQKRASEAEAAKKAEAKKAEAKLAQKKADAKRAEATTAQKRPMEKLRKTTQPQRPPPQNLHRAPQRIDKLQPDPPKRLPQPELPPAPPPENAGRFARYFPWARTKALCTTFCACDFLIGAFTAPTPPDTARADPARA